MPLWNELEGQLLNGLPLRTLLRSEGRTAWFATTDSDGQPAVVSVFETLNDEDAVQARLESAGRLHHPNIAIIRSTGRGRLQDETLVYAVMEPFDQTLAEVLRERTLAPEEAREVSESLLSALEAIEAGGARHGHVDASGVLAVGDSIKLRSDCLAQRAGEGDAPALAALIYNAVTGRRLANERDALQLPAPFATLVRAGLGSAGSLAAMRRVLHGPSVSSATGATAPAPASPAQPSSAAPPSAAAAKAPDLASSGQAFAQPPAPAQTPAPAKPRASAPPPSTPAARSPRSYPPTAPRQQTPARPARKPGIMIGAIALMLLVLLGIFFAFRRPPTHTAITGQAQPSVTANEPAAVSATTPNPDAVPAKQAATTMGAAAPPRETTLPARHSAALIPPAVPGSGSERTAWHVIVYTYTHEDAAQRRAAEIAQRYPQLEPQVFSPHGRAPYFVALGGAMDRDAAMARRDAARKAGLPRDTYAQNYKK
jgi:hypothetical protein